MRLNPQTIGMDMPHGFAGTYARQPDMIVNTRPAGGTEPFAFGTALKAGENGTVVPMGAGAKADQFVGVAAREVKSALSYTDQNVGRYAPGEAVSVFQRGSINVLCSNGAPAVGGAVYLRVTANPGLAASPLGGFEAAADGENSVRLTNCQWGGPADANGVAELVILNRINA